MSAPLKLLFARETLYEGGYELSTNHLARALTDLGHRVLWMTRPLTPISPLGVHGRATLRARYGVWRKHWSAEPGSEICVCSGLARKREIGLRGRWLLRNLYRVTLPSVHSALKQRGVREIDLLCLSDPIQTGLRHVVPYRHLAFQVTDDYSQFENYDVDVAAEMDSALSACDFVLFTNDELRTLYIDRHGLDPVRCHYVSHGVGHTHIRDDVRSSGQIEAVFVGNINEWIDWDWLDGLVERLPHLRVTFYGPLVPSCSARMRRPSFAYGGILDPRRRPETLAAYHLGLIPFLRSDLKRCSDPMKLYDYAACGLPILSSIPLDRRFEEAFPSGLRIAATAEDASRHVASAEGYTSLRIRHADDCRRFARANSWARRAEQLLSLTSALP